MGKDGIKDKLWKLRLNVIFAYEDLIVERSIKSTKDKISGYGVNDILMKPDAMQHMINVIENERKTDNAISDFGRSKVSKKKEEIEEDKNIAVTDDILANIGRSQCTTQPEDEDETAMVGVERSIERKEKGLLNAAEKEFFNQVKILVKFLAEHKIKESFKCKNISLDKENIDKMLNEVDIIEYDNESDRKKVLLQIEGIGNDNLFDFCDRKPYQCLVCPYYYEDFKEFWEMKKLREDRKGSDEDE